MFTVGDLVTVNDSGDSSARGCRAQVVCVYPGDMGYDVRLLDGKYKGWNVGVKSAQIERIAE